MTTVTSRDTTMPLDKWGMPVSSLKRPITEFYREMDRQLEAGRYGNRTYERETGSWGHIGRYRGIDISEARIINPQPKGFMRVLCAITDFIAGVGVFAGIVTRSQIQQAQWQGQLEAWRGSTSSFGRGVVCGLNAPEQTRPDDGETEVPIYRQLPSVLKRALIETPEGGRRFVYYDALKEWNADTPYWEASDVDCYLSNRGNPGAGLYYLRPREADLRNIYLTRQAQAESGDAILSVNQRAEILSQSHGISVDDARSSIEDHDRQASEGNPLSGRIRPLEMRPSTSDPNYGPGGRSTGTLIVGGIFLMVGAICSIIPGGQPAALFLCGAGVTFLGAQAAEDYDSGRLGHGVYDPNSGEN